MVVSSDERSEIVFFDVETTIPIRRGQGYAILEFGAILVCPKKLVELRNYTTLIRPDDPSRISSLSVQCNGITKDDVLSAPNFAAIADIVYEILHGRIWAGHNILRFDCPRIREAFAEIDRPPPEPKATIDSLALLTERFGRRAGNMKMSTLATYFGLGKQIHRSLDDVRMNLEVLKYCATVLFLESSLPDILIENCWTSPNAITSGRSNGNRMMEKTPPGSSMQPSSSKFENYSASGQYHANEENHSIMSLMSPTTFGVNSSLIRPHQGILDSFNMTALCDEIHKDPLLEDCMEEEKPSSSSPESSNGVRSVDSSSSSEFLEPDNTSIPSISVTLVPFYRGTQKIQILHRDVPLQLCCRNLKVRFGLSTKFVDHAGRPRLNFVLDALPDLCNVLDASDGRAQKLFVDSGSSSEWRPVVARKAGFFNSPTIRLHLPTVADGESMRLATEIYQRDSSTTQKLVFSSFDMNELDYLFVPGNLVDAYFSLETYDYQQNAGIRLVAKKLTLLSK